MGRRLSGTAAAALTLGLLAACGGGGDDGGGGGDASGKSLEVWIMEGTYPDTGTYFEDLEAAFTEQTGATLNIQLVPWTEAHEKFTTAAAGDTLPDVSEIGTTWVPEFAEAAILADLTDRIAEDGLDDDLVEGLQQAGTVEDRLYGMPWYAGIRALFYRADVFEEHGLEVPETWDELREVALRLKELEPDMIPYPVPGGSEYSLYPFIWGAGGEVAVPEGDGWAAAINSPEAVEGITYLTELATEHGLSVAAADTWNEADALQSFQDGDAAMIINGAWTVGTLLDADGDWDGKFGVMPVPGPSGGVSPSFMGGSLAGVIEGTDEPDLSWELVKLMTTGDFADRWSTETGFFPGQQTLLETYTERDDPYIAPFAEQMAEGGKLLPITDRFGTVQAEEIPQQMMLSILTGSKDVQTAADDAAAAMDRIFQD
ncbi:sugar ABC transporter substrate-binding protein [Streptomyces sp. ACA25]|uniref:sugar ABC transporter substrate-binding protein n=1 Tax=Streptomyces sp. ACA25 TaxID=3022596 RepID=UPI002307EA97|nr:sugar ABC transporter substrate-binding protein [Streptomyces sp. ACA25]MDB1088601.1 sugar ABC transporter substrate-binding protein [Streptomyces sp. ACA25]